MERMGNDNLKLRDKLTIEKTHSNNLKSVFLSKGWKYDYSNNIFIKNELVAYFYINNIIFSFSIPTAKLGFNPRHTIKL